MAPNTPNVTFPPGVSDSLSIANDQGFRAYGAKLATTDAPYNPRDKTGDVADYARYVQRPGVDFKRPWLAVEKGLAFQWPVGLEGFDLSNEPRLAKHSFIGGDGVRVDVLNLTDESLTLSGTFPGRSAPAQIQALRDVVRADPGNSAGKILFLPDILPHAVRCQVAGSRFSRTSDEEGVDANYSIDFTLLDTIVTPTNAVTVKSTGSTAAPRGLGSRKVTSNTKYNTLRKIAKWKLGSVDNWRVLFDANESWFASRKIPTAKAPSYRLPNGTTLFY
jgi:hypothetical protein